MRIPLLALSCAVLFGCAFSPQPHEIMTHKEADLKPGQVRKRIVVLPFVNRSDYQDESLTKAALFEIQQAVENSTDLILIKPDELEDPESLYSAGGEYHFRNVFEQARRASATGVVVGRIESLTLQEETQGTGVLGAKEHSASARVTFQLYDVGNEAEVFTRTATAEVKQERVPWLEIRGPASEMEEGKQAVGRALEKVLDRFPAIARKLAWVGRIAKIDLNRFYITGGEQTGLRPGLLLRVYEPGTAVTDRLNGNDLGHAPGRFKGLLRITETFGTDASVAVLYTGAGFREQDRVEIHNPDHS
ncbi:hypothetical protein K2X33_07385 [bacterium]|nr:hypothetical protein [bacterium]